MRETEESCAKLLFCCIFLPLFLLMSLVWRTTGTCGMVRVGRYFFSFGVASAR